MMVVTPAIQNLIRENKTYRIDSSHPDRPQARHVPARREAVPAVEGGPVREGRGAAEVQPSRPSWRPRSPRPNAGSTTTTRRTRTRTRTTRTRTRTRTTTTTMTTTIGAAPSRRGGRAPVPNRSTLTGSPMADPDLRTRTDRSRPPTERRPTPNEADRRRATPQPPKPAGQPRQAGAAAGRSPPASPPPPAKPGAAPAGASRPPASRPAEAGSRPSPARPRRSPRRQGQARPRRRQHAASSARCSSTSASSTRTSSGSPSTRRCATTDRRLGEVAVERGLVTEDQLLQATAEVHGMRVVNLEEVKPTPEAVKLVPQEHGRALQDRAAHATRATR